MLGPLEQHAESHKEGGADPLDALLMRLKGYDYTGLSHQFAALDPTTKALLFKGAAVVVTDHGALTGLADDDHTQYYNAARHTKAVHDSLAIDHGSLTGLADDDHAQYLLKAGGTMVGALILAGAPTIDLHAATKKYVDDNIPGTQALCFVRLSHDQVIAVPPGKAVIELDAEDVDVGSNFNTTTHRFTAPADDYYSMAAQLWLDGQTTNKIWKAFFQINGTYDNANVIKGIGHLPPTGNGTDDSPRVLWPVKWLNEGDYVEFWAGNESGADQTVQGIEAYEGHKTWMSIIQL